MAGADLGINLYMAGGGRYRRRRFGVLAAGDVVTRKAHQPHVQSRDYNQLNGGIERWLMPVDDAVTANVVAQGLLRCCTAVFDRASPADAAASFWHIEMHQFRIEATSKELGARTPEGAHRDGVDWVCVMLIDRTNVTSRIMQIFDPEGRPLGEFTVTDPLDTVFLNDRRVFYSVAPIAPLDQAGKACRDVLVLTHCRERDCVGEGPQSG
ncbi:2OG-Fe dioxygenase family protein [Methyloceanibacter stevinii]|uniref:2OG-Fe dioxygenase family protein n=1 Tax=Methyloceanibacter stevinii TaxID=1774970 RepID=UPI0013013C1C|nr:2OG-Fe dioxygenase family protein [Methyloceanibacter stevinii]